MKSLLRLCLIPALFAACSDTDPLDPALPDLAPAELGVAASAAPAITVFNWNIYIGADVDRVIGALANADPTDDLPTLLAAIQELGETHFPARAHAIADAIGRARPEVVGLQEVSKLDIDLTGLGLPVDIHLDFLPILQAALAARGLHYDVAAMVTNIVATPFPGISVVDHDALLVDPSRVTVQATSANNYVNNLGVVAPGIELKRGWVAVTGTIRGRSYTFATTHLESGAAPGLSLLRAAQATELVTALGGSSPVIIMGDLNDGPGSPMYQVMQGAGYTDVWDALRPGIGAAGLTCCHLSNLSNPRPAFDQRIDYVMARGLGHPMAGVLGRIDRLGDVPADRLPGPAHPIWPSDHVGLVANLVEPPAHGLIAARP